MGDPKKQRKKYSTPSHPWQGERINSERAIMREYGLANKKKLWKMEAVLKSIKTQAKSLIGKNENDTKKEKELFLRRLVRLGLIKSTDTKLEDILAMDVKNILERRLQTILFRKGFAKSMKQASQFIIHKHVTVNGKKMNVPAYIVPTKEESSVTFSPASGLSQEDHPERSTKKPERAKAKPETKEDIEEATDIEGRIAEAAAEEEIAETQEKPKGAKEE